jgi:hypothetical protein
MEKESSVVSADKPTKRQMDWATGYSLCDGCSRLTSTAKKNQGLAKQIDAGAGFIDWYFKTHEQFGSLAQPGKSILLKATKTTVTPQNTTTAALYSYTPHLQGNRLLWSIWNRWFGYGLGGLELPDGTLVRSEKTGAVALMQGGKFRPIVSKSVLQTRFNANNIVDLNAYDFDLLQKTQMGRPVRFADQALVRTEDGSEWLLLGNERRRFASADAFRKNGFNPEEVETVTLADIADYADGVPIGDEDEDPAGSLLQDKKTGAVYFVASGVRHPLWDKAVQTSNYPGRKPQLVTSEELAAYRDGNPIRLGEGTLARYADSSAVYVISSGLKRPIASAETFEAYGYDWKNVLTVARSVLDLHDLGAPLTLDGGSAAASKNEPAITAGEVVPVPASVIPPTAPASSDRALPTPVPASKTTTTANPWW